MIVFDLVCTADHRFEGWFSSSGDFETQQDSGLLVCPQCGDETVRKAPMAPAVPAKGDLRAPDRRMPRSRQAGDGTAIGRADCPPVPAELARALSALAKAQAKALAKSTWVGDEFASRSRAMHRGEMDAEIIHGRADREEAEELLDEGVVVTPLLVPFVPPEERN
jgi:hypothetical protein